MSAGYTVTSGSAVVALVAATPKTVVGVVAAANIGHKLVEVNVEFDGVTSTAVPVLVELCDGTGATAGTPGATPALKQIRGAPRTPQCTGANAFSAEPTVLSVLKHWLVHPQTGRIIQLPLGREVEHVGAGGTYLRCTAPAGVNCRAGMEVEEG